MTSKLEEEVYRGIHYIRISSLPADQQTFLKEWLPEDQSIKIMIKREILDDCVQYHHYVHWYENVYPTQEQVKMEVSKEETPKNTLFNFSFLRSS